ncbi:uncharacterized protein LOC122665089 [Telopea speciosissima]|uniref:uncharacterized protein LOC122665089 n=1 Tax=Telopea speciosissima TaxID=54955 RepID=UPI001CC797D0|nr:uncharacterized protein LOC122665089 [Telopea speciosissima]
MQQRKSALGRPSGTDGSDFSYRMVVDPRYTKVAQGKSRLYVLIVIQAVIQVIGVVCAFLSASDQEGPNNLAVSSITFGFISLIVGELGRRRSQVSFLRAYMLTSSIAAFLSVACVIRTGISLEVIQNQSAWATHKLELLESGRALLGVLLQIITISTTVSLICNMSPPKRAS